MPHQTFDNVWYSPRKKWHDLHLLTYSDVGKLTIKEKSIEFQGRGQTLMLENVRRILYGKQGRDFVNNWVRVEYGDVESPSIALFADGSTWGWGGVLGGTKRIFEAAKHLVP